MNTNELSSMQLFKIIHSELIMSVQYIEQDLRIIYSMLKPGDYQKNFTKVDNLPLGNLLKSLRNLDNEIGFQKFKEQDFNLLNEVRNIRNYWCHQCYLDFHYINDDEEHYNKFLEIKNRLHHDEEEVFQLQQKIEKLRKSVVKKYKHKKK